MGFPLKYMDDVMLHFTGITLYVLILFKKRTNQSKIYSNVFSKTCALNFVLKNYNGPVCKNLVHETFFRSNWAYGSYIHIYVIWYYKWSLLTQLQRYDIKIYNRNSKYILHYTYIFKNLRNKFWTVMSTIFS